MSSRIAMVAYEAVGNAKLSRSASSSPSSSSPAGFTASLCTGCNRAKSVSARSAAGSEYFPRSNFTLSSFVTSRRYAPVRYPKEYSLTECANPTSCTPSILQISSYISCTKSEQITRVPGKGSTTSVMLNTPDEASSGVTSRTLENIQSLSPSSFSISVWQPVSTMRSPATTRWSPCLRTRSLAARFHK